MSAVIRDSFRVFEAGAQTIGVFWKGQVETVLGSLEGPMNQVFSPQALVAITQGIAWTEKKVLNRGDYIPILSSVTGSLRISVGYVQIVAFFALSLLFQFYDTFHKRSGCPQTALCKEHVLHGLGNVGRGTVASIFILGNLFCIAEDAAGFRMKYSSVE